MNVYFRVAMMVQQEGREAARDGARSNAQTTLAAELAQRMAEGAADRGALAQVVGVIDEVVTTAVRVTGKLGEALKEAPIEAEAEAPSEVETTPDPGSWSPLLGQLQRGAHTALSADADQRNAATAQGTVPGHAQSAARSHEARAGTAQVLSDLASMARARVG